MTEATSELLSKKDRQLLIAGLIGEYECLCHDDLADDDMTPAEHYALLITYGALELLEESDLNDSPYDSAQDFYNTYSSYIPEEYSIE